MLDSLGNGITALIAVLALAGALGAGWQRGKIGQLRGEVADSDRKAQKIADELRDTMQDLADSRTEVRQLRRDLDAVVATVTGEAHWVAIAGQLDDHHHDSVKHWKHQTEQLERIAKATEGPK